MIEFRNVTKAFENDVVIKSVDFKILPEKPRSSSESAGPAVNDSQAHPRLIRPDEGQILIEGQDITRMGERELVQVRRRIGMVFQEGALFDSLSVRKMLDTVCLRNRPFPKRRSRSSSCAFWASSALLRRSTRCLRNFQAA